MNQNEMGFTFAGRHSREFGLLWAESKGHALAPKTERSEYSISGRSGTLLIGGETRKPMDFPGSLYLVDNEPRTQREAQRRAREIIAWLCQGRQRLTFDWEPDRFYLAQVDKEVRWSLDNWFGGQIDLTFHCQPWAYSVEPDRMTVNTTETAITVPFRVSTMGHAPLEVRVTNIGTAPLVGVSLMGGRVLLDEMNIVTGGSLTVTMEEPVDAAFGDGTTALPHAQRFDLLTVENGLNMVPVVLAYGSGSHSARVELAARGRW